MELLGERFCCQKLFSLLLCVCENTPLFKSNSSILEFSGNNTCDTTLANMGEVIFKEHIKVLCC